MIVTELLDRLFPAGHDIAFDGQFFSGTGKCASGEVAVVGTRDKALIGIELAMQMAKTVIQVIKTYPGRPILLMVDTGGQKMSRRDEMLGLNGYIAHLAKSLHVARMNGHRIIGFVHGEAVSAGFLSSSLLADACYALAGAEVKVMNLPAMSRVTKIPVERLEELSRDSAVFAPGVANFVSMGAVRGIWKEDRLADCLLEAFADTHGSKQDTRRIYGEERGGRKLARSVSARVRGDVA